jgi:hypothetical protein
VAILLLLGGIVIFVNSVLFSRLLPGLRSDIDISVYFFFLSVLSFVVWALFRVFRLKVPREPEK